MSSFLNILILSDGKPGHANQSIGLAEAIGRITPVKTECMLIESKYAFPRRPDFSPDLLIGAGHTVHFPLFLLSRRIGVPCVLLMKPSLPTCLFDLCVIPAHDLRREPHADGVIVTQGVLNRIPPPPSRSRNAGLILIGGPSGGHDWSSQETLEQVRKIVLSRPDLPWTLTDSRRTPTDFLSQLQQEIPTLTTVRHQDTTPEWLPYQLGQSSETWVTEDSVSMIYESLSSGARVGLLPVPRKKKNHRVTRGLSRLIGESWVTPFELWSPGSTLPLPPTVLREADRVAQRVLECFFESHTKKP